MHGRGLTLNVDTTPPMRATLRDGTSVVIRPLHPDDEASIGRGFAHLSLETRRHRLFTEAAKLAPGHGALLVLADGDRHLAWGIATLVDGIEHGIGVARVIRDPSSPEAAEFAIAIVEDWQRHGAGLLLAQALAARSREIGIRRWVGVGYLENRGILALLSRVGREVSRASFGDGSAAIAYEL